MTGYEAYCLFTGLKRHFTNEKYDYVKYNGKSRYKPENFENRSDKSNFIKLAKKTNPYSLVLSNILHNDRVWITDVLSPEADIIQSKWERIQQSIQYTFKKDLGVLNSDFNSNFKCIDGQYPLIITLMNQGKITMETVIILDRLIKFLDAINEKINDTIIWPNIFFKIRKYSKLIDVDSDIYRKVVINTFD